MLGFFAALLSASVYLCVLPLYEPRGPFVFGHYRLVDIYVGIPIVLFTLAVASVMIFAPLPRRWFLLARVSAALVAVLVTLLGMDVMTAIWRIERRRMTYAEDPILGWARRPFEHWRGRITRFASVVDYHADENGFRNSPKMGRAAIAFVGDSFTEGPHVEEEQTFVHLIGSRLGVGVVNLGRAGYGPSQELEVMRRYAFGYQPRLIVWQLFEGNDLQNDEDYRAWREHRAAAAKRPILQYVEDSPFGQMLSLTLLPIPVSIVHRDGVREAYPIGPTYLMAVEPTLPRNHPVGTEMAGEALMEGARLAAEHQATLLVIFLPTPMRVLAPYLEFQSAADRASYVAKDTSDEKADFTSVLGEACRRSNIPSVDLLEPLAKAAQTEDRGLFVPGDVHLAARGHEIVAEALTSWIRAAKRDGWSSARTIEPLS